MNSVSLGKIDRDSQMDRQIFDIQGSLISSQLYVYLVPLVVRYLVSQVYGTGYLDIWYTEWLGIQLARYLVYRVVRYLASYIFGTQVVSLEIWLARYFVHNVARKYTHIWFIGQLYFQLALYLVPRVARLVDKVSIQLYIWYLQSGWISSQLYICYILGLDTQQASYLVPWVVRYP